ncbi:MAG: hypothetical protein O4965_05135, partial [Trichodesmium sp. St19_bin1]|nr:hypothetical protein [Trichodesmium sp. St19_bin1]
KFYPFHSYSTKQAIEEGFILNVLQHYTTYKTYCRLEKKIIDDPEFDSKQAKKKIKTICRRGSREYPQKVRSDD